MSVSHILITGARRNMERQRGWVEEHGSTLAGYQTHYTGSSYTPDDVTAIYQADVAKLDELTTIYNLIR